MSGFSECTAAEHVAHAKDCMAEGLQSIATAHAAIAQAMLLGQLVDHFARPLASIDITKVDEKQIDALFERFAKVPQAQPTILYPSPERSAVIGKAVTTEPMAGGTIAEIFTDEHGALHVRPARS